MSVLVKADVIQQALEQVLHCPESIYCLTQSWLCIGTGVGTDDGSLRNPLGLVVGDDAREENGLESALSWDNILDICDSSSSSSLFLSSFIPEPVEFLGCNIWLYTLRIFWPTPL